MSEPTESITAEDLFEAKIAQIRGLVDSLSETAALVESMRASTLGAHQLWLGGLPNTVSSIQQQSIFLANQVSEAFGLPAQNLPTTQ